MSVSQTFTTAAREFGAALAGMGKKVEIVRHTAMTLVAIGFLSKMTRKEINQSGREITGMTDEQWASGKTVFSMAWRSIAGEYGMRDALAEMWARKDYTVSLDAAYDASAGPAKEVDLIESLARKLATLDAGKVQEVLSRYVEIAEVQAYAHSNIQAIVSQNVQELILGKVENKIGAAA